MIHREVENHERTSQTAICERMRGGSYEEIAKILGKDAHRSRAVFWDDIKQVRKNNVLMSYLKNEDWWSVVHYAPPVSED